MVKTEHLVAFASVAYLSGRVLEGAGDAGREAWLLLVIPVGLWWLLDWLAVGAGPLRGSHDAPGGIERFFCYLFIGVGSVPCMAAAFGMTGLATFKPGFLPTLLGDAIDVAVFCILGLISVGSLRILGWSSALFGWSSPSGGGGVGPGGGGGCGGGGG